MPAPKTMHCNCGSEMRPVEFFYDAFKDGKFVKAPSCNAWFCAACSITVLDKNAREKGEFAAMVAEYEARSK
jgi:hypothetical protein